MKATIIGAGPIGLSAGIQLKQRGWDVTLIESRPLEFTRPQIVMLNPPAVSQLLKWGVKEMFTEENPRSITSFDLSLSFPFKENAFTQLNELPDASNEELINLDLTNMTFKKVCDIKQKGFKVVPIKEMQKILLDKAIEVGVEVVSAEVTGLLADGLGKVVARVMKDGKEMLIEPDLIILAEGSGRKLVQQSLGIPVKNLSPEKWCTLRVHQLEKNLPIRSLFKLVYNAEYQEYVRIVVLYDKCVGRCVFTITLPSQLLATNDAEKIKQFSLEQSEFVFGPEVYSLPIIAGSFVPFTFQEKLNDQAHFGSNLLMVGDAARSGSHFSGLGTNMGISIELGQCLNTYLDHYSPSLSIQEKKKLGQKYTKQLRSHAMEYHNFNNMIVYDTWLLKVFAAWPRFKAFLKKRIRDYQNLKKF